MAAGDQVVISDAPGTGYIEQPAKRRWTRNSGWVLTRRWEGPVIQIDAQLDYVATLNPDSVDLDDDTLGVVEATWGQSNGNWFNTPEAEAIWELIPVQVEKDLKYCRALKNADVAVIEQIDELIREGLASSQIGAWPDPTTHNYKAYAAARLMGVQSYPLDTYMIRQTVSTDAEDLYLLDFNESKSHPGQIISYQDIGVPLIGQLGGQMKWTTPMIWEFDGTTWQSTDLTDGNPRWLVKTPEVIWEMRRKVLKCRITRSWLGAEKFLKLTYGGDWNPGGYTVVQSP